MGKKFTIGVLIGNVHTAHPKDLMRGIRAAASGMDVNVIYFLGTQSVRFNQKFALEDFDYQYNTGKHVDECFVYIDNQEDLTGRLSLRGDEN